MTVFQRAAGAGDLLGARAFLLFGPEPRGLQSASPIEKGFARAGVYMLDDVGMWPARC